VASFVVTDFGSVTNFKDILRQAVPLGIVAIGETVVILTGGIDISVAPMISMANTLSMGIMAGHEGRVWIAVVVPVLAGVFAGSVSGVVVAKARVPAFIVTLGAASVIQGIVFAYTHYATYGTPAESFAELGFADWGPLPALVVLFLPLLAISLALQNRTRAGRHLYAVGGDADVARNSGIRVDRVKIAAYAISGGLAALAGVVLSTRTGAGEPLAGVGFDWDAVAAVVMGGTALAGGRGGIAGTMAGVLIIATINDAMNLMDVSTFWQGVVKGLIILIAVLVAAAAVQRVIKSRAHGLRGIGARLIRHRPSGADGSVSA
jgi:ribose transport system permease protein